MSTIKGTTITLLVLLIVFAGCTNQQSDKSGNRTFTSAELIGKWNSVVSDESPQNKDVKINSIQLVNDSVVAVQIIDSTGVRMVEGTWKNNYEKKLGISSLTIKTDILVEFSKTDHDMHALLLKLCEEKSKLYMVAGGYKFQKE